MDEDDPQYDFRRLFEADKKVVETLARWEQQWVGELNTPFRQIRAMRDLLSRDIVHADCIQRARERFPEINPDLLPSIAKILRLDAWQKTMRHVREARVVLETYDKIFPECQSDFVYNDAKGNIDIISRRSCICTRCGYGETQLFRAITNREIHYDDAIIGETLQQSLLHFAGMFGLTQCARNLIRVGIPDVGHHIYQAGSNGIVTPDQAEAIQEFKRRR